MSQEIITNPKYLLKNISQFSFLVNDILII